MKYNGGFTSGELLLCLLLFSLFVPVAGKELFFSLRELALLTAIKKNGKCEVTNNNISVCYKAPHSEFFFRIKIHEK